MPADDGKDSPPPLQPHEPQPIELEPIELEPAVTKPRPTPPAPPARPVILDTDQATYDLQEGHDLPPTQDPPEAVPLSEPDPTPPPANTPPRPVFQPDEPQEPSWPDTVGSICMLLAGVGLLYHGLTLIGLTLDLTDSWQYLWRDRPEPNYYQLIPNMILEVVLLCIEPMLLYGGYAMRRRWLSSVATLKAWAGVKIVLVILRSLRDAALLLLPVSHMLSGQTPETPWGHYHTAFMVFLLMMTFAWGLVLPVFLLMMFRRKSIQEELATWE